MSKATSPSEEMDGPVSGIVAAEVAVSEDDYRTAEKALLKALGEVRKRKSEQATGGD